MSTNYKTSNQDGNLFFNGMLGLAFTAGIFIVLPAMHILGQITMEQREVVTMDASEAPPPPPPEDLPPPPEEKEELEVSAEIADTKDPPILDRLSADNRGYLISLSVQDHYVEITTSNGQQLVLLRLVDAIKETDGVEGLQTHRSHWVAKDAVVSGRRSGDRAFLKLVDGREIPVSRTNVPEVIKAGLL